MVSGRDTGELRERMNVWVDGSMRISEQGWRLE